MIREHAHYLLDTFEPMINSILNHPTNISEEHEEALASEVAALRELKDETIPLVLLKTYSTIEAITYNLAQRLTDERPDNNRKKMQFSYNIFKDKGIFIDTITESKIKEFLRLLVNCYKHNDSNVDSQELADLLPCDIGDDIKWGGIKVFDVIASCEIYVNDLTDKVFLAAG